MANTVTRKILECQYIVLKEPGPVSLTSNLSSLVEVIRGEGKHHKFIKNVSLVIALIGTKT